MDLHSLEALSVFDPLQSLAVFEKKCALPSCGLKKSATTSKLKKCSVCYSTHYCCREHQKEHWRVHKAFCREIVAKQTSEKLSKMTDLFDDAMTI